MKIKSLHDFRQVLILSGILSFFSTDIIAQFPSVTSYYRQNWQWVNPAAMDKWEFFLNRNNSTNIFSGNFRRQWVWQNLGSEAPQTWHVAWEYAPSVNKSRENSIRVGAMAFGDEVGTTAALGLRGNFSYYFRVGGRKDFIHIGLSGGVGRFYIKDELTAQDEADPLVESAAIGDFDRFYPDFALGIFYRKGKIFYTGLSIPQIFTVFPNDGQSDIQRVTPIYWVIGSFIEFGGYSPINRDNREFALEPSLWVRYASNTNFYSLAEKENLLLSWVSLSGDLRVYYQGFLWFGAGYGTNQMASVEFGMSKDFNYDTRGRFGLHYSFPAGNKLLNLGHSLELSFAVGLK